MDPDKIDYETATEEELAELRGDTIGEDAEKTAVSKEEASNDGASDGEAEDKVEDLAKSDSDAEGVGEAAPDKSDETKTETTAEDSSKQDFMIPKSRYDSVMARLKEAEARNREQDEADSKKQEDQIEPIDVRLAEIDKQIAEAVSNSEGEKAAELMAQSRELQAEMFSSQMQESSQTSSAQAIEQVRYDNLLATVERLVPEINPDSENYDTGLVIEVQDLKTAFEAKGNSSSNSLVRALNYVRPGWDTPNETETENTDQADDKQDEKAEETKPDAKKTDVEKNIKDAKATPPRMDEGDNSDTGGKGSEVDVMKLSDNEFEKLSEEQLSRLRGDHF